PKMHIVVTFMCTTLACSSASQDRQNTESLEATRSPVTTPVSVGGAQPGAPRCAAEPGRKAEQLGGGVLKGNAFTLPTAGGWILELVPIEEGWFLQVTVRGREEEDLSRLTPPWHGVPNPRMIEGWHFRNEDNTGPNDGSVNAPGELREFIFSPDVGRSIEYNGSATSSEDVAKVQSFGRGWLHLDQFRLTPMRKG